MPLRYVESAKIADEGVKLNQVGEIEIPVPPLNLQEEFAGVVARVESQRGRNSAFEPRESARQVDGFFELLLSEAFV